MNNPVQFVQMMRNPQMMLQQMMGNNQLMQNPIAKNAMEMLQKNDTQGLEELARNLCNNKGINADEKMKELRKMFGM